MVVLGVFVIVERVRELGCCLDGYGERESRASLIVVGWIWRESRGELGGGGLFGWKWRVGESLVVVVCLGGSGESERAWWWFVWVEVERVRELGGGLFGWKWRE